MSAVASRPTIEPLHPLFAAEFTGIDRAVPVAREDLDVICEVFNEHQVLVHREQMFDDATQTTFSRDSRALETAEAHAASN